VTRSGFLGFLVLALIVFFISHREAAANLVPSIGAMLLDAANPITTSITELM
jgi:hypothetical protein